MRLGLYKTMRNRGIRIHRTKRHDFDNIYQFLDHLMETIEKNLNVLMKILNFCKDNNLDLLMHDDILRHLNNPEVFKHNYIIFEEFKDKFKIIKNFVDKNDIRIYIYTSMMSGLNSIDVELREKSRMDIQMKSKFMDIIGGAGVILQPNTFNGKKPMIGFEDIMYSYEVTRNALTDKYLHFSNGYNCANFTETYLFAKRYGFKTCYNRSFEYNRNVIKGRDFTEEHDMMCANTADVVVITGSTSMSNRWMKKKEFIEKEDFPDFYYRIKDKTLIINQHYSDDSIDNIRNWK